MTMKPKTELDRWNFGENVKSARYSGSKERKYLHGRYRRQLNEETKNELALKNSLG